MMIPKVLTCSLTLLLSCALSSCGNDEPPLTDNEPDSESSLQPEENENSESEDNEEMETNSFTVQIANREYTATLDDTPAALAFKDLLPLTLDMYEMNGNEKYASLPQSLPSSTVRPGTLRAGDILLWQGNTVVLFYKTFTSSYSYTRIGRIDNPAGIADAVGRDDVTVTFK